MSLETLGSAEPQQPPASAGKGSSKTPTAFPWTLELALSGGGLRAAAYALGALIYLCHCGANKKVRNISSVSGGSLTNAFVACHCDFRQLNSLDEFRPHAERLIHLIAKRGLYTSIYGLAFFAIFTCLVAMLVAGIVLALVTTDTDLWYYAIYVILLALLSIGTLFSRVSWFIRGWMKSTFLRNDDDIEQIGKLSGRSVDHVFCATDLNRGSPYFFSTADGGRQYSWMYGRADGERVPIVTAVQASAAFPPLIPPVYHRPCSQWARFRDGHVYSGPWPYVLWLTDGGAFNNYGTDWHRVRKHVFFDTGLYWNAKEKVAKGAQETARSADEAAKSADEAAKSAEKVRNNTRDHHERYGEVQLVIDASQVGDRQKLWSLFIPVVAPISYVLRVMNVMYSSTLYGRSDDAVVQAIIQMRYTRDYWRAGNPQPLTDEERFQTMSDSAVKIHVPYSWPLKFMFENWTQWESEQSPATAEFFLHGTYDKIKHDLKGLWEDGDKRVSTTFGSLGTDDTLSLVVSGYLLTRQALSGAFGFRPLHVPKREWFEGLLGSDKKARAR